MRIVSLIFICLWSASTLATNGYFMIAYGAKSIALAGSGVAAAEDRLVGALNPAGMSLVPDGFDVGLRAIGAQRSGSIDCRGIFACNAIVRDRSSRTVFVIPNFGWKKQLRDDLAVGVAVYGNGGINTNYGRAFYRETIARIMGGSPGTPGFPRTGKLGVDFSQLLVAPSLAYRISDAHTIGIAPIFSLQRFSTRGLELFAGLSSDPTSLTGRGTDYNVGGGVRVGWQSEIYPGIRLGAQYTSRVWTGKAEKYAGLLADGGQFDAPSHWTIGLAWQASKQLTTYFDFQRIYWESIDSIANAGPSAAELAGNIAPNRRLGASNTIGFGWRDQSVFKLGLKYAVTERLMLRAGWNYGSSVIPNKETLINIIAPATVNNNFTIGGSWRFSSGELSLTYKHSARKTNSDPQTNLFGTGARASILQYALDIAWAKDF